MSDNYLDYFSLKEDPFRLTPDPDFYFPSVEHTNALLSMEYCIRNREGFCLLVGEPGTGKTTLVRMLLKFWQEEFEIALIMTPRLNPEELLQAILEDFGVFVAPKKKGSKHDLLKAFRTFLLSRAEIDKRVVILVDEAQNLPDDTLEELRLLSNLETEKQKLLQIILVGQPELASKLSAPHLKQLDQRISVRQVLSPLALATTSDYLATRLLKGGAVNTTLFSDKARERIHRLTGGIPRLINLVASRALMVAYLENSRLVEEQHTKIAGAEALKDERGAKGGASEKRTFWVILMTVIAAVAAGAAGIALYQQYSG